MLGAIVVSEVKQMQGCFLPSKPPYDDDCLGGTPKNSCPILSRYWDQEKNNVSRPEVLSHTESKLNFNLSE